ncbi:hypothetical protein [Tumidithrix elongata]
MESSELAIAYNQPFNRWIIGEIVLDLKYDSAVVCPQWNNLTVIALKLLS